MANYILRNDILTVTIAAHGAEMKSIKKDGREYLWKGDEAYWGRTSPILFPLVGNYVNKTCHYHGKTYLMSQHGFARDQEFQVLSESQDTIWFRLRENEKTLETYPFCFTLDVGYHISGNEVQVLWRVINSDDKMLHFSIGGHPAFCCPLEEQGQQTDDYLDFHTRQDITYGIINGEGCYTDTRKTLSLTDGLYRITPQLFDEDALIVEGGQTNRVSLCDLNRKPYVTVRFDAPLFGLWSPAGKHAPFVCIEPWYGRCDHEDFTGALQEREYGNSLEPEEEFNTSYTIEIH